VEGPLSDRERWDRRYADGSHSGASEPTWLDAVDPQLPRSGRALDVAAGSGSVACWLARRGLEVLAIDVSPVGLRLAEERAAAAGVAVVTRPVDLQTEDLPAGPWDVISCFHYLQRSLFAAFPGVLAPGGWLVCEIATLRNLERHARPSGRFLLEEGELFELVRPLEIVHRDEGWREDRAVARVLARKV